jgi:hypothetical protein
MAAIDFPNTPAVNDLFVAPNGVTYQWTGVLWAVFSGPASTANIASFFAYGVAGQSGAAYQLLPLQTPVSNVGGYFNAVTSRFTPPAGIYYMEVSAGLGGTGAQFNCIVEIRKNGSAVLQSGDNVAAGAAVGIQASGIVVANGTDYFEAWINAAPTSQALTALYTHFSASSVSAATGPQGPQGSPGLGGPVAAAHFSVVGGVVTINKQSGITSIVRTAVGQFTVTLSSAMADLFYRTHINCNFYNAGNRAVVGQESRDLGVRTTSIFYVEFLSNAMNAFVDPENAWFSVFA